MQILARSLAPIERVDDSKYLLLCRSRDIEEAASRAYAVFVEGPTWSADELVLFYSCETLFSP